MPKHCLDRISGRCARLLAASAPVKGHTDTALISVEQAAGMAAQLTRLGHPMLAALLTVGLSAPVQAEAQPVELSVPRQEAPLSEELELLKEEETVSIASRYDQ